MLFVFGGRVKERERGIESIALDSLDEVLCIEVISILTSSAGVEVEFGDLELAFDGVLILHFVS